MANLNISYDDIEKYAQTLRRATQTQSEEFSKFSVVKEELEQISSNLLQIEDEYYAVCRPKSNSKENIRPTSMLKKGGIDYIELDIIYASLFKHRSWSNIFFAIRFWSTNCVVFVFNLQKITAYLLQFLFYY